MAFDPWDTSSLPSGVTAEADGYRLVCSGSDASRIVPHTYTPESGKFAVRLLASRPDPDNIPAVGFRVGSVGSYLGGNGNGWGFWGDRPNGSPADSEAGFHDDSALALGELATFDTPTEIMLEIDIDTGDLWFGADGTWANSGDPGAGSNPTYTGLSGTIELVADMFYDGTLELLKPADFTTPASDGFQAGWGVPPVPVVLSGVVQDADENPLERTVRAYKRADGAFLAEAVSDSGDGSWTITEAEEGVEYYVIAVDLGEQATDYSPPVANRVQGVEQGGA